MGVRFQVLLFMLAIPAFATRPAENSVVGTAEIPNATDSTKHNLIRDLVVFSDSDSPALSGKADLRLKGNVRESIAVNKPVPPLE